MYSENDTTQNIMSPCILFVDICDSFFAENVYYPCEYYDTKCYEREYDIFQKSSVDEGVIFFM